MAANLHPAEVAKNEAEAECRRQEAAFFAQQSRRESFEAELVSLRLDKERDKRADELADDRWHHVYQFAGAVSEASVKVCITQLSAWVRQSNGQPVDINIVLNSPGGSIFPGFALIDFMLDLRAQGHRIRTTALGVAASMAGVILQAGDVRSMGRHAFLLIHEAQFGATGAFGEIQDQVKLVEMMQDRILNLFAERSTLTRRQIKTRWHRKDWWIPSDEALRCGFVDEVV